MIVAYVLDRFPAISETFISDEIYSVMQTGVPCHIFSIEQGTNTVIHPRAKQIVDSGHVSYFKPESVYTDFLTIIKFAFRHPIRTVCTLVKALFNKEHRWLARLALNIAFASQRVGITHLHAHYADTAAQLAMWVHRWTGLPFTFTTHRYDIFETPPNNIIELVEESQGMICISHYNLQFLVNKFGIDEKKLSVIRCGIYVNEFENETRVPISKQNTPIQLLCVARLVPEKGHKYLFEAVHILISRGHLVNLILAGDGPLRNELKSFANELEISSSVQFMGAQTGTQVQQLFHDCDIAVLASLSESMGLVNMEAMASGRPVIATAVLGVPELVEDRVTGFLCPPGEPVAIADTVQWILAHPMESKQIIENGKVRVKTEFSRDACSQRLVTRWKSSQ